MQVYPACSRLFLHTFSVSSSCSTLEYDGIVQPTLILRELICWSLHFLILSQRISNVNSRNDLINGSPVFQVCFCNERQTWNLPGASFHQELWTDKHPWDSKCVVWLSSDRILCHTLQMCWLCLILHLPQSGCELNSAFIRLFYWHLHKVYFIFLF